MCLRGKATRITTDHKPDLESERERIEKLGGWVKNGAITGSLTVSRSLGDFSYKPFITCEPDVFGPFSFMEDDYQFLILACDGLWDVVSDQEAVEIVLKAKNPEDAAVKLRDKAFNSKSKDNISVLVIYFPQYPQNENHIPSDIIKDNNASGTGTVKKRTKNSEEKKEEKKEDSGETGNHSNLKKSNSKNTRIKKKDKSSRKLNTNLEPSVSSKKTRPVSKSDAAEKPKKPNKEKAKTGDDE